LLVSVLPRPSDRTPSNTSPARQQTQLRRRYHNHYICWTRSSRWLWTTQVSGRAQFISLASHSHVLARYTIVIYTQGTNFTPPQNLSSPVPGVELFDFPGYVKSTNLGPLVAGIYYQVQEGTATVSLPATSSVISSTLPAAQPSSSGTPSGTGNGSKPTNTGSNNNTSGAMGNVIRGSFLSLIVVLSYIMM
jgi:hypothetical protein